MSEDLSEYIDDFMVGGQNTTIPTTVNEQNQASDLINSGEMDSGVEVSSDLGGVVGQNVDTEDNIKVAPDVTDIADEEMVHVEVVNNVEATPFFPDALPVLSTSPEGIRRFTHMPITSNSL